MFGPGAERVGLTCNALMVKSASQSLGSAVTTGAEQDAMSSLCYAACESGSGSRISAHNRRAFLLAKATVAGFTPRQAMTCRTQ